MATICLQCGDEGFTNAFVYCIKCLNVAVHRYCLFVIPKTFDEFVPWVCEDCEVESTGRDANTKFIRIENGQGENRPLLLSAYEKLDIREDSRLEGDGHPSGDKLTVNKDSDLRVVVEKEQACEIGSPQQICGPQSVDETVADGSSLSEDCELSDDCHSSTVKLEAANNSNILVVTEKEQTSQIFPPHQIREPEGEAEVVANSSLPGEDSKLAGDCHPSIKLKTGNYSDLRVVVEKEQECQIGSSQQILEPQGIEVVADGSPSSEDSKLAGDRHSSNVKLKANNDSVLPVVVEREQACQIGSTQQILEVQGIEVVADGSPPRDDSKLAGDCHPSKVKLKADSDSSLPVVVEREQACQIGSTQQIHESQGVEVVTDVSPLRENAKFAVDGHPSRVKLKAGDDSKLQVVGEKKQARQKGSGQPIREPQGVGVAAVRSTKKEGPIMAVKTSPLPNAFGNYSKKNKLKNRLKPKAEFKKKHEKKVVCFNCGKEGHVKWKCTEHVVSSSSPREGKRKFNSITSKPHTNEVIERVVRHRSDVKEEIPQLPPVVPPIFSPGVCSEQVGPIPDIIWRGSFNILNNSLAPQKGFSELEGFVAHLSVRAGQKAYEGAKMLPSLLHLKMLPKAEVWPKSFLTSQPNDNIALYIFPVDRRYERTYDNLVEDMRQRDLALRAILSNAELLIFTSAELPELFWRFQQKYYLWGVFRGQQSSPSNGAHKPMVPNPVLHRTIAPGKFVSHVPMGLRVELNLPKVCNAETHLGRLQHSGRFMSRNF